MISVGKLKMAAFTYDLVEEVRDNFHSIRKESSMAVAPQVSDVEQMFRVRLIQSLRSIFRDSDSYFCNF